MTKLYDPLWAGTEDSFHAVLDKIQAFSTYDNPDRHEDDDEESLPRLLQVAGEVGIVSIKGPLINSDNAWMNTWMGVVGYPEIRQALLAAATMPAVKTVLLDIDSPGGQVSGMSDIAELVKVVDQQLKPVFSYAEGSMASAAYYIGSSARQIYASKNSLVGSIGVIATHIERSKMLEDVGIKATLVRAGRYKQLANPYEPLTDEAKAELQSTVDSMYATFVSHVAEVRNKPTDYVDQHMAQGRVFVGANAMHSGLVDAITTFDEVVSAMTEAVRVDTRKNFNENKHIGATMHKNNNKKPLTAAVIAAMAELGQAPEAVVDPAAPTQTGDDEAQATAAAAAQEGVDATSATTGEGTPDASDGAQASAEDTQVSGEGEQAQTTAQAQAPDVSAFYQTQIATLNAQLVDAKVEAQTLRNKLEATEQAANGLLEIAARSVNNMQIALGGSATSFEGATATQVLAEHTRVSQDFQARFRVGGVASAMPAETDNKQPKRDSLTAARLAAASTN